MTEQLALLTGRQQFALDPPWEVMGGPPWGGGSSKPLPYPTMTVGTP